MIEAGPLLELAIDGERMVGFVRRKVLADLVESRSADAAEESEERSRTESAVIEVLRRLGGSAAMADLARETGERPERLRAVCRSLEGEGLLRRTGERFSTRYHLAQA